jgi:DNA-binding response OmpR family regulator
MNKKILLIGDEKRWLPSLWEEFQQVGYRLRAIGNGDDIIAGLDPHDPPDLILLDVSFPNVDGLTTLQMIRKLVGAPIIILADQAPNSDQIQALETGADDFLSQPFTPSMLVARIRAILRRYKNRPRTRRSSRVPMYVGLLTIDPATFTVTNLDDSTSLPPSEFELLYLLAQNAGQVVPIRKLLRQIWQDENLSNAHLVYVHICGLRQKLAAVWGTTYRINTVRGVGYKLDVIPTTK